MRVYASSRQALDYLCKTKPPTTVLTDFGLVAIWGSAGLGILYQSLPIVIEDLLDGDISIGFSEYLSMVGVAMAGSAVRRLVRGVLGVFEGRPEQLGHYYLHNNGFTQNPSLSAEKFGKRVKPLEELAGTTDEGCYFLNNVEVGIVLDHPSDAGGTSWEVELKKGTDSTKVKGTEEMWTLSDKIPDFSPGELVRVIIDSKDEVQVYAINPAISVDEIVLG